MPHIIRKPGILGGTTLAVFWIASSVTQPVFGALGEDVGLRLIGCMGVLMASAFLSLIGAASELWLVFVLLVIGGLGSAALHRRWHGGVRTWPDRHPVRRLQIRQ